MKKWNRMVLLLFSSLLLHAYPPGWSDDILLTPQAEVLANLNH